jgi:hypothetical protein
LTARPPKPPSPELVRHYIGLFDGDPTSGPSDRALSRLFAQFRANTDIEEVLLKVATLNSLYNTNIFSVAAVADQIVSLDIDPRLAEGSPEIVEEIAVVRLGTHLRRNYSFATKYCSWHAPNHYPIYDNLVERLLWRTSKPRASTISRVGIFNAIRRSGELSMPSEFTSVSLSSPTSSWTSSSGGMRASFFRRKREAVPVPQKGRADAAR